MKNQQKNSFFEQSGTSQTGVNTAPLQVENVQYNVTVGKVVSKAGFASKIFTFFGWVTAIMATLILLAFRAMWLPDVVEDTQAAKETLVFAVAVLVPVLPIWIFSIKRLNKVLVENSVNLDDVFFKKSIRFHLFASIFIACGWAIIFVYNILAKIILDNQEIERGAIVDSFLFFLPIFSLGCFFWSYQKQTKR